MTRGALPRPVRTIAPVSRWSAEPTLQVTALPRKCLGLFGPEPSEQLVVGQQFTLPPRAIEAHHLLETLAREVEAPPVEIGIVRLQAERRRNGAGELLAWPRRWTLPRRDGTLQEFSTRLLFAIGPTAGQERHESAKSAKIGNGQGRVLHAGGGLGIRVLGPLLSVARQLQ